MDNFEKVEKLRERASVSYEEAKNALEESGWDMLDAMVLLEKNGKTNGPQKSSYSTDYDQQEEYAEVKKTVYDEKREKTRAKNGVKSILKGFIRVCRENVFCIGHKEKEIVRIPVSILVILLVFFWKLILPAMLIGLFLGFKYSFEGQDDLKTVNNLMNTAESTVNRVKKEFADSNAKAEETAEAAEAQAEKTAETVKENVEAAAEAVQEQAETAEE